MSTDVANVTKYGERCEIQRAAYYRRRQRTGDGVVSGRRRRNSFRHLQKRHEQFVGPQRELVRRGIRGSALRRPPGEWGDHDANRECATRSTRISKRLSRGVLCEQRQAAARQNRT